MIGHRFAGGRVTGTQPFPLTIRPTRPKGTAMNTAMKLVLGGALLLGTVFGTHDAAPVPVPAPVAVAVTASAPVEVVDLTVPITCAEVVCEPYRPKTTTTHRTVSGPKGTTTTDTVKVKTDQGTTTTTTAHGPKGTTVTRSTTTTK